MAAKRPQPAANVPPLPAPVERKFISNYDGTTQTYLLSQPAGPAKGVLVYLHGATSHQDQGMTVGIYRDSFGFVRRWAADRKWLYACPEYRGNSWMNAPAEADVEQILDELRSLCPAGPMLLVGGSMGGTAALIYATRHRQRLDGVLSLCPATDMARLHGVPMLRGWIEDAYGGTPRDQPDEYALRSSIQHAASLAGLPVYLVHGSADVVIDVSHSRQMAQALERQGGPVRYVEIPGGDHDSPIGQELLGDALEWLVD